MNTYIKWFILVCVALTASATSVLSSEVREIELSDGSVISGEVLSLSHGIYTIKSASLGTVQIDEQKIRAIRQKGLKGTTGESGALIKSMGDEMLGNEEIVDIIRSLQNDPDFLQVLQDPAIMKAVQSGDIATLMSNQRFMDLLNKQSVQQIKTKILR